jgi:hypothetical protein
VACILCQYLESELERIQRTHAEKYGTLVARAGKVHPDEYRRLQSEESDARLELDSLSVDLRQHKRLEHNAK